MIIPKDTDKTVPLLRATVSHAGETDTRAGTPVWHERCQSEPGALGAWWPHLLGAGAGQCPGAAVTDHHKPGGVKRQKCPLWPLGGLTLKAVSLGQNQAAGRVTFPQGRGAGSLPVPSSSGDVPWLVATSPRSLPLRSQCLLLLCLGQLSSVPLSAGARVLVLGVTWEIQESLPSRDP